MVVAGILLIFAFGGMKFVSNVVGFGPPAYKVHTHMKRDREREKGREEGEAPEAPGSLWPFSWVLG